MMKLCLWEFPNSSEIINVELLHYKYKQLNIFGMIIVVANLEKPDILNYKVGPIRA